MSASVFILAAMWKATALDPSHLVVQVDCTDDERAAFKVDPSVLTQKVAWKYDAAVKDAANSDVHFEIGMEEPTANNMANTMLIFGILLR